MAPPEIESFEAHVLSIDEYLFVCEKSCCGQRTATYRSRVGFYNNNPTCLRQRQMVRKVVNCTVLEGINNHAATQININVVKGEHMFVAQGNDWNVGF